MNINNTDTFQAIVKQSTNPIIVTDSNLAYPGPKIVYVNNALCQQSGYTKEELIDISPDIFQGKDSLKLSKTNKDKIKKLEKISFKTVNYTKDGKAYHVKINIFALVNEHNEITNYVAIKEDITEYVKEINYLQKFINLQDNIIILTNGQDMEFANQKLFDFFDFKDMQIFKQYHTCICERFIEDERFFNLSKINPEENWVDILKELPHSERIVAMLGQDFKIHAFSVTINTFDKDLDIVTFSNISQTVLNQIRLQEKTVHDKLTCAFNREYFEQNYRFFIEDSIKDDCLFGLALLDIDHFKNVNDTHGHDVGDYVLKHMVQIIDKNSRENDILIRWGGEEFIMIFHITSTDALHAELENVRKVIETENFETVGTITCSFGATVYKNNEDIELTIKRADDALYYSKRTGRNKITIE